MFLSRALHVSIAWQTLAALATGRYFEVSWKGPQRAESLKIQHRPG